MFTQLPDLIKRSSSSALLKSRGYETYKGLYDDVDSVARYLTSMGVRKGGRVALLMHQDEKWVVSAFAIMKAGAILVPLDPSISAEDYEHIIWNSEAELVLTSIAKVAFARKLEGVEAVTLPLSPSEGGIPYTGELPEVLETDIAALFYTSGSTGRPKGVTLTHRNMLVGAQSVSEYLKLESTDVVFATLPLHFDAGFSQLTTAFYVGATVAVRKYVLPSITFKGLVDTKATVLTGIPTLFRKITGYMDQQGVDYKGLRLWANTGGAMDEILLKQMIEAFPEATPYLMYGLTEAFRGSYLDPALVDSKPDSIGKAIPYTEIKIENEFGEELPNEAVGQIVQYGPTVSRGYWKNQKETDRKFVRDESGAIVGVRSGDLGYKDKDGDLFFVGRQDEMIKISGVRISPTDVENRLKAHVGIKDAVVFGIPHKELGQVLQVITIGVPQQDFKEILPRMYHPEAMDWIVEDSFPTLSNGKIDRPALRRKYGS